MKSLLVTALLSMGVAHSGAFLEVWEVPYVEDHFTYHDLSRKLDKVFKVKETTDSLRNARHKAAEENYALLSVERGAGLAPSKSNYTAPWQRMKSTSSTRR